MKKILLSVAMLALGALLFNSCNKNEVKQEIIQSQDQFHSVLRMNMGNVGSIPVGIGGPSGAPGQYGTMSFGEFQTIYLDIQNITPDVQARIENVSSLRDISELVVNYGAIVELANVNQNFEIQFDIPVEDAKRSLELMVKEAKRYLLYRGFTEREIYEMIVKGGATEYDLVPLVIFLQEAAFSGDNPFMGCAAAAIGVNAVGGRLSRTAIEQVFNASVSRVSGPVAAVIAVGNYMHCLVAEMDVLVETMLTSDEFEALLEKQESFIDMFSIGNYLGTPQLAELTSVTTNAELMAWIDHNISLTQFTSVAQASSMLDALETQTIAMNRIFISPRMKSDIVLFEDRAELWIAQQLGDNPRPSHGCPDIRDHCIGVAENKRDRGFAVCAVFGGIAGVLATPAIGIIGGFACAGNVQQTFEREWQACWDAFWGC